MASYMRPRQHCLLHICPEVNAYTHLGQHQRRYLYAILHQTPTRLRACPFLIRLLVEHI